MAECSHFVLNVVEYQPELMSPLAQWQFDAPLNKAGEDKGGMGEVVRVIHRRSGRRGVLKRVRAELVQDPLFRKRFEAECRITSNLIHPNIVQVLDIATEGAAAGLVTEYLEGGSLDARLARGMHLSFAVKVVSDLARALDFAASGGVVHGDVKPGNVLFRDADTAVLIDFGAARLSSADNPDRPFASLAYASPEVLLRDPVDVRTDLYSLGVILFQILTGDVPFPGKDVDQVVSQQHNSVPRLPIHLAPFQPIMDRLLARRPEQRFQTGEAVVAALDQLRLEGSLPGVTIRTGEVTSAEIRAVAESVLVTFKDPRRAEARGRRRQRRRIVAMSLSLVAALVAVSSGAYWLATHPEDLQSLLAEAGFAEKPGLIDAWNEAQSLRQDPNQGLRTLVAAYERVLQIDPQHANAREGLASIADEWKSTIDGALRDGNFSAADARLQEARLAFPDDAEFSRLVGEVEDRRNAEALLESTRALLASHGLSDAPSATAAIQAFNEVQRLAPGHPIAMRELETVARHYAGLASERVAAGDVESAIGHLDRASTASPDLPEIAAIRQSIQQANTTRATIGQFLEEARQHRESGALVAPADNNAAVLYHQVLSIDPGNTIARQGLDEVVAQLREVVATRLSGSDFPAVADLITQSSAVNLDPAAVEEFRRQLVSEQTRIANLTRLLSAARRYIADGYLTAPDSGNATQSLREVQRLDPGNTEADTLLREVARRLAQVAQEAWDAGLRREAQEYLDLALAIVPGITRWQTLREEWTELDAQS